MQTLTPSIIVHCAAANAQGRSQLASTLGVTSVTITRWAGGKLPSSRHVKQLAEIAGVSVVDLLRAFGV